MYDNETLLNGQQRVMRRTEPALVCIVGLGYVGLPLALLCARKGFNVVGIDNDSSKIALLKKKLSPIRDESVAAEVARTKVRFFDDENEAPLAQAEIFIICVPTPVYEDHTPNFEPLVHATEMVGRKLSRESLVIVESSINPGVSENVVLPILERQSGMIGGIDFELSHCPERINPGDANWGVTSIPRVAGSLTNEGLYRTVAFYESILDAKVRPMNSLKEAEAVKMVENAFRDVNIAFVNELAMSFAKIGIDVVNVIDGAATKPFSFLPHLPGCGVGGHCIPVDPYYLIDYGKQNGFAHELLTTARTINDRMPIYTVELLERVLEKQGVALLGTKVAVLGLAYKPNVDDTRESPAWKIIARLKELGAEPVVYDPYVIFGQSVGSIEEAVTGAQGVIIATGHREFLELEGSFFAGHGVRAVVDGRNCLSKEKFISSGVAYAGIGRL